MRTNIPKAGTRRAVPDFTMMPTDRTGRNGHKLNCKKFYLNIRKFFFALRVAEYWKRLSRTLVESASLESFKTHLDTFVGHLV